MFISKMKEGSCVDCCCLPSNLREGSCAAQNFFDGRRLSSLTLAPPLRPAKWADGILPPLRLVNEIARKNTRVERERREPGRSFPSPQCSWKKRRDHRMSTNKSSSRRVQHQRLLGGCAYQVGGRGGGGGGCKIMIAEVEGRKDNNNRLLFLPAMCNDLSTGGYLQRDEKGRNARLTFSDRKRIPIGGKLFLSSAKDRKMLLGPLSEKRGMDDAGGGRRKRGEDANIRLIFYQIIMDHLSRTNGRTDGRTDERTDCISGKVIFPPFLRLLPTSGKNF